MYAQREQKHASTSSASQEMETDEPELKPTGETLHFEATDGADAQNIDSTLHVTDTDHVRREVTQSQVSVDEGQVMENLSPHNDSLVNLSDLNNPRAVAQQSDTSTPRQEVETVPKTNSERLQPRTRHPAPPSGIRPQPAVPVHRNKTPRDYRSRYEGRHPWAHYITERPSFPVSEATTTSDLDSSVYRHLTQGGYFASRFVRSLFPRAFVGRPSPSNKIPIMELMRISDAIEFRRRAEDLIDELLEHRHIDHDPDVPVTSPGLPPTGVCPPERDGVRPVLYQVVSKGYGQGVVLEAKDFFVFCPDHYELHCIILDQYSTNVLSGTRGFDRAQMSVKDFVWVLSLRPTRRAIEDPENVLEQSRQPRATAMDTHLPFFFRVREFILVTPPKDDRIVLGLVLSVPRRGPEGNMVNNIRVAFEGSKEAVIISPRMCEFNIVEAEDDQWLFAETRRNSSCAVRFSQPPISKEAQRFLVNAVRRVLPAYPDDNLLPLRVFRLTQAEEEWIADREGPFLNYGTNPKEARRCMGKIFGAACAALAATNLIADDKSTRFAQASVPSLTAFPMRLDFQIREASAETGWINHRPIDVWFVNTTLVARMVIADTVCDFANRTLHVRLHSTISCHKAVARAIEARGRIRNAAVHVDVCVRLARPVSGTDPLFELLAEEDIFGSLNPDQPCHANDILDALYNNQPRRALSAPFLPQQPPLPWSIQLGESTLQLRADQINAVLMGTTDVPLLAIQAAFGTGKTVIASLIAARLASANPDHLVIATATTNAAVAQFTDTLLRLTEYRNLNVLRFVADASLAEGCPRTPVDLHTILPRLATDYRDDLTPSQIIACESYANGRRLLETAIFHPEQTVDLAEDVREEYRIAERESPEATEEAVKIMYKVRRPNILCLTTASLLNSTGSLGLFGPYFGDCRVILSDEASQIPEPVLVATTSWFPEARLIYIGDVKQLEPHARCQRTSRAARHGARGAMDILLSRNVPTAPLLTTFRAHPALNELPNRLFYGGRLVNGTPATQRQLLTERVRLPNPLVPFVWVDVRGESHRAPGGSHSNPAEAECCREIIQALVSRGIPTTSIAILVFYKEQQHLLSRYATQQEIALHTVDSIQGSEADIVILLTTRSDLAPNTGAFLDDSRRMNVALTRCKHGQFVLGNTAALRTLHNWSGVIRWAEEQGVIVSTTTLNNIFP